MRFIEWVMEQRKTKKFHEIASELGMHPSYLGHIKNGKFSISKKLAERVEEVSGGLCKKEEIVFEKIDPNEWRKYDEAIEEPMGTEEDVPDDRTDNRTEESVQSRDPFDRWRRALL